MAEILMNHSETKNEEIKKIEQKLYENEFIKTWKVKEFPEAYVYYIKDDVYWVCFSKKWVSYYLHENWDTWFSIWWLSETPFFSEALKNSWYIDKTELNWRHNLYKIDESWKIADIPVDKAGPEFFQVWKDVDFFTSYKVNAQTQSKRLELKQFLKMLPMYIESESFRIKHLMEFYSRWQIQKIDVIEQLPALQKLLIKQCDPNWDLLWNFEKVNDPITEDELRKYYNDREIFKNKWLIDENTYAVCLSWLRKRESEKRIKKETKEEIKN